MKAPEPSRSNPPWLAAIKALWIAILVVLLFMLGEGMARHRFHRGGRRHWNGSIGQ